LKKRFQNVKIDKKTPAHGGEFSCASQAHRQQREEVENRTWQQKDSEWRKMKSSSFRPSMKDRRWQAPSHCSVGKILRYNDSGVIFI
jgi:hypothetical protein